jgi:hypothetical protein
MDNDSTTLEAAQLLAVTQPEALYSYSPDTRKSEWQKLSSRWHPDRAGGSTEVFQHVKMLYEQAAQRMLDGEWQCPGATTFNAEDGRVYTMAHRVVHTFELGQAFIGNQFVTYSVDKQYKDLYEHAVRVVTGFPFKDSAMRAEVERYLPQIHHQFSTKKNLVMVVKKSPDLISLRDILTHSGGSLDAKHVAWMVSWAYSLSCYLRHVAGVAHGHFSPDTVFISPHDHRGALLGGWWYAAKLGQRFKALPARALSLELATADKPQASAQSITNSVRAFGRELLGDMHGSRLLLNKHLPAPVVQWLRGAGTEHVVSEYSSWQTSVLPAAFGKRRFVTMELSADDLYPRS